MAIVVRKKNGNLVSQRRWTVVGIDVSKDRKLATLCLTSTKSAPGGARTDETMLIEITESEIGELYSQLSDSPKKVSRAQGVRKGASK